MVLFPWSRRQCSLSWQLPKEGLGLATGAQVQKQTCGRVEQPISFLQNEVAHMDTEAT